MKKLTAILVLAITLIAAQVAAEGKIPMGLEIGLNMASLRGDDVQGAEFRTGLSVGGFVEYPVSPMVSVMGEVLYTMKGGRKSYEDVEPGLLAARLAFNETFNLDYLEVPVLLKINMTTSGRIRPYLLVGPGIAFNIAANWEETNTDIISEDLSKYIKSFDYGIIVGGGVNFPVRSHMMSLGARYELGLFSVDDGLGAHWREPDLDIKNNVISVVAGFAF
jgi:opacity protein-like surface antigen